MTNRIQRKLTFFDKNPSHFSQTAKPDQKLDSNDRSTSYLPKLTNISFHFSVFVKSFKFFDSKVSPKSYFYRGSCAAIHETCGFFYVKSSIFSLRQHQFPKN